MQLTFEMDIMLLLAVDTNLVPFALNEQEELQYAYTLFTRPNR